MDAVTQRSGEQLSAAGGHMDTSWEQQVEGVYPLAKEVSDALEGTIFPATLDVLVWVARENEAPRTVISLLYTLPRRSFASLDEVQAMLGTT
jgi:hypothetical protein